ncbi:helix-turn-helix domain-containing protein [Flavobacterium olei]|uniref:helix-turn-helix domain-containing protein n=1 Tax=Flavobacterium olei TaxID=1886782 RepID=UPI00321BD28D
MHTPLAHQRLDQIYDSEIINLRNIKIVSNHATNIDNVILYENADTSPFKRKEDVVLTLLLDGKINSFYQGINNEFQASSRSCTFVYSPNDNQYEIPGSQHIDSMALGINKLFFQEILNSEDRWMNRMLNQIEKNQPFSLSKTPYKLTPEMYSTLQKIRNTQFSGSLRTLHLQGLMSELLLQQFQEIKTSENTLYHSSLKERDIKKIKDLKMYIDIHYLDDLTLDFLARLCGLNTFKVKTGFKSIYGKSVFEYIRGKRMEHASLLLLEGGNTISEVAYLLGYQYVQHFSTAFKKHFGVRPAKFKF